MADTEHPLEAEDLSDEPELEVDIADEPDVSGADLVPCNLGTYLADYTVEVPVTKVRSGDLKIPCFQRRYVWD